MDGLRIDACQICLTSVKPPSLSTRDTFNIDCPRCGNFNITEEASDILHHSQLNNLQIANASGHIRQNQGVTIDSNYIETLKNSVPLLLWKRLINYCYITRKNFQHLGKE